MALMKMTTTERLVRFETAQERGLLVFSAISDGTKS